MGLGLPTILQPYRTAAGINEIVPGAMPRACSCCMYSAMVKSPGSHPRARNHWSSLPAMARYNSTVPGASALRAVSSAPGDSLAGVATGAGR